jgi:hypothetical protein
MSQIAKSLLLKYYWRHKQQYIGRNRLTVRSNRPVLKCWPRMAQNVSMPVGVTLDD